MPSIVLAATLVVSLPAWAQPANGDSSPLDAAELLVAFGSAQYFWQQTDVARQLAALGDRSVLRAIAPFLATNDRRRRSNAAFVLAALGDENGTNVLIQELEDTSATGRELTDAAPNQVNSDRYRSALAQRQVTSDRYFAALLLGELRAKKAVPALIQATRDPTINYQAAYALGSIGDPSATAALREMINDSPEQRVWAAYALAAFGERDGFAILEDELVADPQWVNRRYAAELLGKTHSPRAIPILSRSLHDEHANVRVSTVRALAAIGDPAALPFLQEALADHEVTQVNAPTTAADEAQKAIEALGRSRP